jgi:hypothetical protein
MDREMFETTNKIFGKLEDLQTTASENHEQIAIINTKLGVIGDDIKRIGDNCPLHECRIKELEDFKQNVSSIKTTIFIIAALLASLGGLALSLLYVIKK